MTSAATCAYACDWRAPRCFEAHFQLRHGSDEGVQTRPGLHTTAFTTPLWLYESGACRGVAPPGFNDVLPGPEYSPGYASDHSGGSDDSADEDEEGVTADEGEHTDDSSESSADDLLAESGEHTSSDEDGGARRRRPADEAPRRVHHCRYEGCGEAGHNARSCPLRRQHTQAAAGARGRKRK